MEKNYDSENAWSTSFKLHTQLAISIQSNCLVEDEDINNQLDPSYHMAIGIWVILTQQQI